MAIVDRYACPGTGSPGFSVQDMTLAADAGLKYPAGLDPSALLALNSNKGPQATHHTMGNLLCPLIADGWDVTVKSEYKNTADTEAKHLYSYWLSRDGDAPIIFMIVRFTKVGRPPIEMLDEIHTPSRIFRHEAAWPFINEIFSQRIPACLD
ncbi:MAG: hypothetical protein ABW164_00870 [Sphingobium sp.]